MSERNDWQYPHKVNVSCVILLANGQIIEVLDGK